MNAPGQTRARHLRVQVSACVCLLVALAAAGVGEWLARSHAKAARTQAGVHLLRVADEMADRLSQEMAARTRDVQALADNGQLKTAADPAARRQVLETLQATLPQFSWIGVTDPDGNVVAATGGLLEGKSIASRPVFQNGRQGLWTGDVHEAVLLAKLVPHPPGEDIKFVDVATPLREPDGTLTGVLAAHLSWQWADQLRQTVLRPRGGGGSMQLMVVGAGGDVLLPPEKAPPGLSLPPARVAALSDAWSVETWSDGREALSAVAVSMPLGEFRGFGWQVVARDLSATAATAVATARPEAFAWALGLGALVALIALAAVARILPRGPGEPAPASAPRMGEAVRPQRRTDHAPLLSRPAPLAPAAPLDDARRDRLTGLGNTALLDEVLARLPAARDASPIEACLLAIDLERFDQVNARYGRPAGDEVLVQVARRLRQAAREGDNVFRLRDDDFLVVLTCPPGEGAGLARAVAARVLTELQRPLSYRTLSNLRINASVGGAVWPVHGPSAAEALAHAHEALHAAKRSGPGVFRLYA